MSGGFPVRGNVPALVTPFGEDGAIRYEAFERIVEWHIRRGADAICVAGDNGESWALSVDHRAKLAAAAVGVARGRVPVVMGAGATTARQSIAYAEAAAEAGVAALMLAPQPYVLKATTGEIVARLEAVHRAVPLPLVLYDSPRRTGIALTVDSVRAICEAVPVVALKEASRDFFHLTHIILEFSERLAVLVGPAPFIVPGLQLGAAGFLSSGPEFFDGTATVLRTALEAPSPELRALHYGYTLLYETLMSLGTWPSALKHAHDLVGLPAGVPHEPVAVLGEPDRSKLRAVMRELGLIGEKCTAEVAAEQAREGILQASGVDPDTLARHG